MAEENKGVDVEPTEHTTGDFVLRLKLALTEAERASILFDRLTNAWAFQDYLLSGGKPDAPNAPMASAFPTMTFQGMLDTSGATSHIPSNATAQIAVDIQQLISEGEINTAESLRAFVFPIVRSGQKKLHAAMQQVFEISGRYLTEYEKQLAAEAGKV